jgi:hypothetical protein
VVQIVLFNPWIPVQGLIVIAPTVLVILTLWETLNVYVILDILETIVVLLFATNRTVTNTVLVLWMLVVMQYVIVTLDILVMNVKTLLVTNRTVPITVPAL